MNNLQIISRSSLKIGFLIYKLTNTINKQIIKKQKNAQKNTFKMMKIYNNNL